MKTLNDAKINSNQGAAIQPLPLPGDNLDLAEFYLRSAKHREGSQRVRVIAKAIHYLTKELQTA